MPNELSVGGAQAQLLHLAARLRDRGDEVAILTINENTAFHADTQALGIPVVQVRYHPAAQGLTSVVSAALVLRAWRPDAVMSFIYQANVVARIAARLAGVPVVLSSIRNERFGGRHRELLMRATDRLATVTTTNSRLAAKRLVGAGVVPANRLVVIPNGIQPAAFQSSDEIRDRTRNALQVDDGDFIWLSAGRLVPQKDYPTMLRAFAHAFHDRRSVGLLIAGEGPLRPALEELAGQIGPGRRVRFLGLRDDIPDLLAACDGFVLSSAHEGLPNVVMEAMAAARPVVATSVGGVPELVETGVTGQLVPPTDPTALADAMAQVAAMDVEERVRMGEAGRARMIERFSLDGALDQWLNLLDNAVDGQARREGARRPISTEVAGAIPHSRGVHVASGREPMTAPQADHTEVHQTGLHQGERPRVLHVAINAGGGLTAALEDFIVSTADHEHHLLVEWDSSFPVDGDLERLVASMTEVPRGQIGRVRSIRSTVERIAPDVIHAHSSFAGASARLGLAKRWRQHLVYTPHCFSFERTDVGTATRFAFWIAEAILSFRGGRVAACSPVEASRARTLPGPQPVSYVPNVVRYNVPRVEVDPPAPGNPLTVVTVGRVTPQKAPELLARAADHGVRTGLSARWVWIGGGDPDGEDVLRRAGVEVTGWLLRREVIRRMAHAHVYVHTAAWEGAPITVLEAAVAGIPIVARRTKAMQELGVAPLFDTVEELVTILEQYPDGPAFVTARQSAERLRSNHTAAAQREALLAVYRDAATSRVAGG
jgi:glycosyltransferase involved in cell wall biosynthesis